MGKWLEILWKKVSSSIFKKDHAEMWARYLSLCCNHVTLSSNSRHMHTIKVILAESPARSDHWACGHGLGRVLLRSAGNTASACILPSGTRWEPKAGQQKSFWIQGHWHPPSSQERNLTWTGGTVLVIQQPGLRPCGCHSNLLVNSWEKWQEKENLFALDYLTSMCPQSSHF
jgi:hypothetical protein